MFRGKYIVLPHSFPSQSVQEIVGMLPEACFCGTERNIRIISIQQNPSTWDLARQEVLEPHFPSLTVGPSFVSVIRRAQPVQPVDSNEADRPQLVNFSIAIKKSLTRFYQRCLG